MNDAELALWQRLEALSLDDPQAAFPFSARLARENGWTLRHAQRVINEYKRFVFLTATMPTPACPSEAVDEAWHLHLCYTRSYWHELCRDVLGRPLHHEPTRGGGEQLAHHWAMYERTLAAYRAAFGGEPPADVWPPTAERFAAGGAHQRVDRTRHWIVPKPRWLRMPRRRQSATPLRYWLLGVVGIPVLGALRNPLDLPGPSFLVLFAILLTTAIVVGRLLRSILQPGDDGSPVTLDAYEAAALSGGSDLAPRVALSELLKSGHVHLTSGKTPTVAAVSLPPQGAHPLVRAIYDLIAASGPRGASCSAAIAAGKPGARDVVRRLRERGLSDGGGPWQAYRWAPALLMAAVLGLGLAKINVGVERNKPVEILTVLCVIAGIGALLFLVPKTRTRRGERVLNELRGKHKDLENPDRLAAKSTAAYAMGLGLFGLGALAAGDVELASLHQWMFPKKSGGGCSTGTSSGCSGGGGCGGGGCGGGGCGGCGGGD